MYIYFLVWTLYVKCSTFHHLNADLSKTSPAARRDSIETYHFIGFFKRDYFYGSQRVMCYSTNSYTKQTDPLIQKYTQFKYVSTGGLKTLILADNKEDCCMDFECRSDGGIISKEETFSDLLTTKAYIY